MLRSYKKNIQWCYLLEFFGAFQLLLPLWTLFCYQRGLQVENIFHLLLAYCTTILVTEVPTGLFADRFGARISFISGTLFHLIAIALLFKANSLWMFLLSQALVGLAEAFFSGSQEALVYETVKELGEEVKATFYFGRIHSVTLIATVISAILGPLLAKNLLESEFHIILIILFAFQVFRIFFAYLIIEPSTMIPYRKNPLENFKASINAIKASPQLVRNFTGFTIVFIPTYIFQNFQQPVLVDASLKVAELGPLYATVGIIGVFLASKSALLTGKFGVKEVMLWTAIILLAGYGLSFFFPSNLTILITAAIMIGLPMSIRWPIYAAIQNKFIPSGIRATTFSVLSIFDSLLDVLILLALTITSTKDYQIIFAICFGLTLTGLLIPFRDVPKNIKQN